jgi:glycosyltransferase involved in cell wall biosynthesis
VIVGLDATTLKGQLSGVGYYTARLMESLANGAGEGVLDRVVVFSNQEVPCLPSERLHVYDRRRFRVRSVWMQFLLPGILDEVRPDLVHFTNYLAPVAGDTPYVLSIHDMSLALFPECHTWRKRLLTSRLLPWAARGARLILAPSESTRRDVIRLLDIDPARVRVIPYAASPRFRPAAADAARLLREYGIQPPYFLYVGTLEPRKNLERALRAFARVSPKLPEHRFVLVGQRGWKYGAVLREAGRAELRGRVLLPGYVPEEDLPTLYAGATAFVYPSLYEGFGLPVIEAMACGTPVLTTRSSSLAEIAEAAALLVDPRDELELADALFRLGTDASLRAELRERGLARAALFSWDRTGRETVLAYQDALAIRPRRSLAAAPAKDAAAAILRTVTYAGLFEAPLSRSELLRALMDVPLAEAELDAALAHPALAAPVTLRDGYVYPARRDEWIPLKQARRARTRELLERHRAALADLARLPFVRLVALSGACAHDNAADEDVDVFLVIRKNRAWTAMLLVFLLSKLAGLRRSLCVNYAVDEDALALPERTLYTAAELAGLRPLAGREAYLRLIRANAWIGERFPNFLAIHERASAAVPEVRPVGWLERLLELGPAQLAEVVARRVLGSYLRARNRRRGGVVLTRHRLKLHHLDHAPGVTAAFEAALASIEPSELPRADA